MTNSHEKIFVLTDFSNGADYTAHYSLKFAQQIKANLLLCNIYKASANELNADGKKWPLGINEKNSIEYLGALMAHLKTKIDAVGKSDFRPAITQYIQEGLIKDTINDNVSSHNNFYGHYQYEQFQIIYVFLFTQPRSGGD